MSKNWINSTIENSCNIEYGTRVVRKRDAGDIYSVYGGGGATFKMDTYNREDRMVIARFAMSKKCTRFIKGKFFLNDSGLTISQKDKKEIDIRFLNYKILSLNEKIYSIGRGTAQRNLNSEAFKNLDFSYPNTLKEQKQIVEILDTAFEALEKVKTNLEKNLKNTKELFASKLNEIFSQKGEGWEEKKLEDLTYIKSGGTPLKHKKEYWDNGIIPWYSSGELNNLLTIESKNYITNVGLDNSNAKLFEEGSLLIGMYDTAALKMSILHQNATFNQAIAGLAPRKNLNLEYILHYINFKKQELLNQRRGVRQKNLSLSKIKDIEIYIPDFNAQNEIVEKINNFESKTKQLEKKYQQKLDNLEELKKSLLQKAFSGELTK